MREAGEEPVDTAAAVRFDRKRKGKKLSNRRLLVIWCGFDIFGDHIHTK